MTPKFGLALPFSALIVFAILYLPFLSRFLPSNPWVRMPFSPQIFFLVSTLAIMKLRKLSRSDIGFSPDKAFKNIWLGFGVGCVPVALVLVAGLVLTALKRPIFGGDPLNTAIPVHELVTLLLLAPICEELFFRGILLRSLREHYPSWLAVFGSALLFMGSHGHLALGALVLGIITALLPLRTGSIVPGIVFHAVANAYGPVMVAWFPNLYRYLSFFYS